MVVTNHERKVLSYLLMNGPSNGNKISRTLELANSTVSTRARSLEKKGLVAYRDPSKQEILESPRHQYLLTLTIRGLITALSTMKPIDLDIISIRSHWGHLLPGVLNKWDHFKEHEVEDIARTRLILAARSMVEHHDLPEKWIWNLELFATEANMPIAQAKDIMDEEDEFAFTRAFYMVDIKSVYDDPLKNVFMSEQRSVLGWERVCIIDDELHKFFKMILDDAIKNTKWRMQLLKIRRTYLQKHRSSVKRGMN